MDHNILSISDVKRRRAEAELPIEARKVVVPKSDPRGATIMRNVFKENNLLRESDLIFFNWANLRIATTALCEMIGRDLTHDGVPIVDKILIDAISTYNESAKNREPDIKSMVKYLMVLADAAYIVQKYGIFIINDAGERVAWQYFTVPLNKWLKQVNETYFYMQPVGEPSLDTIVGNHILLASRIMSPNDMGKMAALSPMISFQSRT